MVNRISARTTKAMLAITKAAPPMMKLDHSMLRPIFITILIGVAGGLLAEYLAIPLPWLLGPLATTALASIAGIQTQSSKKALAPARTFLGVAIGASFTPALIGRIDEMLLSLAFLPLYLAVLAMIGYPFFHRLCGFDKPTAYYSTMPGGLPDMIAFGAAAGADVRILSIVQATRAFAVVVMLPLFMSMALGIEFTRGQVVGSHWNDIPWQEEILILTCAMGGWFVASKLRIKGATIIGPMIAAAFMSLTGLISHRPPIEIMMVAQLIVGISIGCRYANTDRKTIFIAAGAALGFCALIFALSAGVAGLVTLIGDIPILDTLLAFAPGGQAEMTLLAIIVGADAAFVSLHHVCRVFIVVVGAPIAQRYL